MSELSSYLLTIVGVILILTLIDLILPEGKMGKYIKSIIGVFVVAVIVTPIVKIVKSDFQWQKFFGEMSYQVDYDFLYDINKLDITNLQNELKAYLREEGYDGAKIMISTKVEDNIQKISYIYVDLCDLVINENFEHIDYYTKIKELIAKQTNIGEDYVVVYG